MIVLLKVVAILLEELPPVKGQNDRIKCKGKL